MRLTLAAALDAEAVERMTGMVEDDGVEDEAAAVDRGTGTREVKAWVVEAKVW